MNFVLRKTPRSAPFVVHMDKIKKCHSPPVKDWTLEPESGTAQPDAGVTPTAPEEVQPTQDQTLNTENEVGPVKKPRREVHRRRILGEVGNEESQIVSSPRIRRPPRHLKEFVCRSVVELSLSLIHISEPTRPY